MRRLLILALILLAAPLATAAATPTCPYTDCPLWARGGYSTPTTSTSTTSTRGTSSGYWYDDTRSTQYNYYDIYHPPRVWYVHRNDNYYRTNAGTSTHRYRPHHRQHHYYYRTPERTYDYSGVYGFDYDISSYRNPSFRQY